MLSLEHFSNKTSQKLGLGKGDKNICLSIAVYRFSSLCSTSCKIRTTLFEVVIPVNYDVSVKNIKSNKCIVVT